MPTLLLRSVPGMLLWCVVLIRFTGCDHGLSPLEDGGTVVTGFGGTITFHSTIPPADSLRDLRVVAFRQYPPSNLLIEVTSGRAVFSDTTLVYTRKSINYKIQKEGVTGEFKYVVVAQQYGPNILTDWRVVGVYTRTNDVTVPGSILIAPDSFLDNININVDFYHLPPQPF